VLVPALAKEQNRQRTEELANMMKLKIENKSTGYNNGYSAYPAGYAP